MTKPSHYITTNAWLSDCGRYRYALTRKWAEEGRQVAFIGLNPSTADAEKDDPTIRRCVGFAKREGFKALVMLNLFAWRATDPSDLFSARDPIGPQNDSVLRTLCKTVDFVIAAWGTRGAMCLRNRAVLDLLDEIGVQPWAFGTTKDDDPRHPLYLARSTPLIPYKPGWRA